MYGTNENYGPASFIHKSNTIRSKFSNLVHAHLAPSSFIRATALLQSPAAGIRVLGGDWNIVWPGQDQGGVATKGSQSRGWIHICEMVLSENLCPGNQFR